MAARIGLSVPYNLFDVDSESSCAYCRAFGGKEAFLKFCEDSLDTVEIRSVKRTANPSELLDAVQSLTARGLGVTIHGDVCPADEFFAPYESLISKKGNEIYNITLHPTRDADYTEKILRDICRTIEERTYPFFITLENQRIKAHGALGVCRDVAEIVGRIDSPVLGICFDFGHQLSNVKNGFQDDVDEDFISRVRHTHIHSVTDKTHFPLDVGECELEKNLIRLFGRGYDGILSLELSARSFCSELDVAESLRHSVDILKYSVYQVEVKERAREFYKNGYFSAIRELRRSFDASDNCFALIGHAAYVIKLSGVRIAVDCSTRILPVSDSVKSYIRDWLSEFDAIIVTHSHSDHYDRDLISSLPRSVKKIIPDFLPLDTEGRVTVSEDSSVSLGNLRIRFFGGAHFFMGNGVDEYGFVIEWNGKSYVFPVDARNYSHEYPHFDNVSCVFTHLWLGRSLATKPYEQYTDAFCRFAKSFGARKIYVAHLDEVSRNIENMWSKIHLDKIRESTDAAAPKIGELISLEEN